MPVCSYFLVGYDSANFLQFYMILYLTAGFLGGLAGWCASTNEQQSDVRGLYYFIYFFLSVLSFVLVF
ncbi:hypothetical protein [Methanolapillus ohkumae]|uniref:hypothetical protein n=1 Tax=Methanolapillus ohkumae TaxID=3028298 RepID=UPI0030B8CA65